MAKKNVTFSLDEDLVERMRNACFWVGQGYTPSSIASSGVEKVVVDLEKKHNSGKPFKARKGNLPSGPVSGAGGR